MPFGKAPTSFCKTLMKSTIMAFRFFSLLFKSSQILRFLVVGTVNTGFSYGVYAVLLYLGLDYTLANLTALVLGILFSFKTQGVLVFRNADNRLLGRFIFGWTAIYLANITVIGSIMSMGLNAYVAGALALPFSTLLAYVVQRCFVFRLSRQTRPVRDAAHFL